MINSIINFLHGIGFKVERTLRPREEFLPGISVEGMTLYVDRNTLKFPGDLLHEAGHIAIIPSVFRLHVSGGNIQESLEPIFSEYCELHNIVENGIENPIVRGILQCGEAEAIAWSYAAAIACNIDPKEAIHLDDGDSEELVWMLQNRSHFGINGLQAAGMTTVKTFPAMIKWLQI